MKLRLGFLFLFVLLSLVAWDFRPKYTWPGFECRTESRLVKISKVAKGTYELKAWRFSEGISGEPEIAIQEKDAASLLSIGLCSATIFKFHQAGSEYLIRDTAKCALGHSPSITKGELVVTAQGQAPDRARCLK